MVRSAVTCQLGGKNEWRSTYRVPDGLNWSFALRTLSFTKEEVSELLKDLIRRVDLARRLELNGCFFERVGLMIRDCQGRLVG